MHFHIKAYECRTTTEKSVHKEKGQQFHFFDNAAVAQHVCFFLLKNKSLICQARPATFESCLKMHPQKITYLKKKVSLYIN